MSLQLDLRNRVQLSQKTYRLGRSALVYEGVLALDRSGRGVKVAVKRITSDSRPTRDAAISEALYRASALWSRLNHPYIARFYGLNRELGFNGIPAMVFDYYTHGNILGYLQKRYGPDVANGHRNQEALRLMIEVAQGLDYLHSQPQPLIHGDIRAANILVDDQGHARITDAGLLFAMPSNEIPYLDSIRPPGLCRWTSPELLEGIVQHPVQRGRSNPPNYTTASDVYAFGMTLVEVFSGMPPLSPEAITGLGRVKPRTQSDIENLLGTTKGMRPLLPLCLSNNHIVRGLVCHCWDEIPTTRPSMNQVCRTLASINRI